MPGHPAKIINPNHNSPGGSTSNVTFSLAISSEGSKHTNKTPHTLAGNSSQAHVLERCGTHR